MPWVGLARVKALMVPDPPTVLTGPLQMARLLRSLGGSALHSHGLAYVYSVLVVNLHHVAGETPRAPTSGRSVSA